MAQLELERHEGAEELEQWRRGKLRFSRSRGGLGGWDALQLNKDLHTRRDSRVQDLLSLHTTEVEQRSSTVGTKRRSSFAA